jgi:hypothetical protein
MGVFTITKLQSDRQDLIGMLSPVLDWRPPLLLLLLPLLLLLLLPLLLHMPG